VDIFWWRGSGKVGGGKVGGGRLEVERFGGWEGWCEGWWLVVGRLEIGGLKQKVQRVSVSKGKTEGPARV
jgi:hypothetical protein